MTTSNEDLVKVLTALTKDYEILFDWLNEFLKEDGWGTIEPVEAFLNAKDMLRVVNGDND